LSKYYSQTKTNRWVKVYCCRIGATYYNGNPIRVIFVLIPSVTTLLKPAKANTKQLIARSKNEKK
jgi:hypothetical protein